MRKLSGNHRISSAGSLVGQPHTPDDLSTLYLVHMCQSPSRYLTYSLPAYSPVKRSSWLLVKEFLLTRHHLMLVPSTVAM